MTDIIIIGSGPGGYRAAEYAAKKGKQVVVVEEGNVGGTCLNCGCIPTKALCHHAEIIESLKKDGSGLKNIAFDIDFESIMERKNLIVSQLRTGVETLLSQPGITFVKGHATLKDANTVVVDGKEYTAQNIIIATGSTSKMLPIEGITSDRVVTSTELLNIESIPKRLCIVGAGVIGMEFASIFTALGSEVTVVEFLKECLPAIDSDIAKRLRKSMEKQGVTFYMQSAVKCINDGQVVFDRKGKETSVEADVILMATGRKPNTEGLNLEGVGINVDRGAIVVNDNMETSLPGVYAIGDVNGRQMLAHAATFQGFRAVNHILGCKDDIRLDIMPAAVFTTPQVASVGITEDECESKGIEYNLHRAYYRANGKALAINATEGLVKIITDNTDHIIGCHVIGAHAADIVQEVASLMVHDAKRSELASIVHIHPTLSEVLHDAAMF